MIKSDTKRLAMEVMSGATYEDLSGQDFEEIHFIHCSFLNADLRGAKLIDCLFEASIVSSAKLDGASIQARFLDAKIEGVNFFTVKKTLLSIGFEKCLIRHSSFAGMKLRELSFKGCTLANVDFSDADLTQADFSDCSFEECVFQNTNLTKANFTGARGYAIDPTLNRIRGAKFELPEALNLLAAFQIELV